MRAFVTGGSGFFGRNLIRTLVERGDEVVALARSDAAAAGVFGTPETPPPAQQSESVQVLLARGRQALEERRFDAAIEAFDAVLAVDPENSEATQGRDQARVAQQYLPPRRPQQ